MDVENNEKRHHITKLKQQNEIILQAAEEAESQYVSTIKEQKQIIQEQLNTLRQMISTANNDTRTVECQTDKIKQTNKSTMTKIRENSTVATQTMLKHKGNENRNTTSATTNTKEDMCQTRLISKLQKIINSTISKQAKVGKRRILLIVDHQDRKITTALLKQSDDMFLVQAILKPNCQDDELIDTAVKMLLF